MSAGSNNSGKRRCWKSGIQPTNGKSTSYTVQSRTGMITSRPASLILSVHSVRLGCSPTKMELKELESVFTFERERKITSISLLSFASSRHASIIRVKLDPADQPLLV